MGVFVTAGILWALSGGGMQQSNARKPKGIERSLDTLHPAFRRKVEQLLRAMQALGFRPLVWETYRSPERAAALDEDGSGKTKSMHRLGLAVDIVDAVEKWDAPKAFWDALHAEALRLGLARVKHRDKKGNLVWDLPHVQALPGTLDARVWKLSEAQRRDLVATQLA